VQVESSPRHIDVVDKASKAGIMGNDPTGIAPNSGVSTFHFAGREQ